VASTEGGGRRQECAEARRAQALALCADIPREPRAAFATVADCYRALSEGSASEPASGAQPSVRRRPPGGRA
jgi:hypothetical protein